MNIILVNNRLQPQHITDKCEFNHGLYAVAKLFLDIGEVYILTKQLCEDFSSDDDIIISTQFMEEADAVIPWDSIQRFLLSHKLKPNEFGDTDLELQNALRVYKETDVIFTQFKEDIEIIENLDNTAHFVMLPLGYVNTNNKAKHNKICFCNTIDRTWASGLAISLDNTPCYYFDNKRNIFININEYHSMHDITLLAQSFCVLDLGMSNYLGISSYLSAAARVPCIGFKSTMQNIFYPDLTINNFEDFKHIYEQLQDNSYYEQVTENAHDKLNPDLSFMKEVILNV